MPRSPSLATLILLTMCTTLSLNMFLPALPQMADDFGVSYGIMSLSVGGYLAVTAVLSLGLGPLTDRVGRRPVALVMSLVFALASAGAALSTDIWVFLTFRFVQGVMVGGYIVASATVRDTRSDADVASLLAYITAAMAIAPILAPMLGGVVTEIFGWRAIFWIYTAMGCGLFSLCWWDLTETRHTSDDPASASALLVEPQFWFLVGTLALGTSCFYAFLAGTPLVAKTAFDLPESLLGVALGSITIGFMLGSFTAGRLTRTFAAGTVMMSGRVITVVGLIGGLIATLVMPAAPLALFGATIFIGIGNGLSTPTSNALILSIRPELSGTASGLSGAMTVGCGAVFTTLAAAMLASAPTSAALVQIILCIAIASLICAVLALRRGSPRGKVS